MKWLINPFERIAGWQALFIGLIAMALTAVIGKINNVAFDGVLDVHAGIFSFIASFAMQAVNLLSAFLTMWIAGVCFSKAKVRAIDIAGTMALARAPMLLLAVICFLPVTPAGLYDVPRIAVFLVICLPFIAWTIALMYNAYTVSCHLKGVKAVVSFIGALLVAEVVSKLVFIFLLSGLFINSPAAYVSETSEKDNIAVVVDMSDIHQTAEKIVKNLENGDFDAITVYFDETMKKGLTAGGLKMAWAQVNMAYGQYKNAEIENTKELTIGEIKRLEIPLNFEKSKLYLRIAFNKDGTIGGLFIQP